MLGRFDGGINGPMWPIVQSLLEKHQPRAMAFGGCGELMTHNMQRTSCVTENAIRGTGTEAGAVGDPNWSTFSWPDGTKQFIPSEADTTLQLTDSWFYDPNDGIRSMAELQDVYHQTVGHNSMLSECSELPDLPLDPSCACL